MRLAAGLLAAFVLVAVSPVALVDQAWMGPAMAGAALGYGLVSVVLGVVVFLGTVVPVLLLATAVRLLRGGRVRTGPAVAGVVLVALLAAGPVHALSLASWVDGGRILVVVLAAAAVAALVRASGGVATRHVERRIALLALAIVFVASAAVAAGRDGIPSAPSGLLAAEFLGGDRLTGTPLDTGDGYARPGLARGQGSSIHNDAAQTDAYAGRRALDPRTARVVSFAAGGDCASLLFPDGEDWLAAVCVGPTRVTAHVLDRRTLARRVTRRIADRDLGGGTLTSFAGGGYASLDADDRLVVGTADGTIRRFALTARSIEPHSRHDVRRSLAGGEKINSALPDTKGRIWFVGTLGTVGVLDPRTDQARATRFADSDIENSFALAPDGDAFVVTSRELLRLRAGAQGPEVVWRASYDRGRRQKPGQTSRASGTTPTVLLGGRLVAITDNADPRMHVLVYDARPRTRGRRLICREPVFAAGESATDNSLIAAGRTLFVENNYGYRLTDVLAGHSSKPGFARIDVAEDGCRRRWENDDVHVPSVVSKVSADDGTVLTYARPPSRLGLDRWYVTALDAGTGEVLWQRLAGAGPLYNNHYAALYLDPDGRVLVGTLGGVVALVEPG